MSPVEYLRAEHLRLVDSHAALMAEYQAFVATDPKRADDWIVRLREHRMLIRNHRLALKWMQSGLIRDADTVSEHD
jgi:hypothetical protein